MNFVAEDVFEAVRRGYNSLEYASADEIEAYFSAVDTESVVGHASHIKGILFEQEFVESLMADGVEASLFEATNHPVTDVMVFGGLDGVSELQLKATDTLSYVTGAMQDDPDVLFAVTSEVASEIGPDILIDTGISNTALESAIEDTLFDEALSPFGAFSLLRFLIGIPF